ncbi:MAG TPA: hypothetical protein VH640_03325 [Bryobacteraceae bacterium]|jgi:hypothetical protein
MKRSLLSIAAVVLSAVVPALANTDFPIQTAAGSERLNVSEIAEGVQNVGAQFQLVEFNGIFTDFLIPANTATFLLGTALVGLGVLLRRRARSRRSNSLNR